VKLKSQMQICKRNSLTSRFPAEFKSDRSGVSGIPADNEVYTNFNVVLNLSNNPSFNCC